MKRLALCALLLVGCGGTVRPTQKITISWISDGNPNVPICPAQVPCKSGIEVRNVTRETSAIVPLTSNSYSAQTGLVDSWAVRTIGQDGANPLQSPWVTVR